MKKFAEEYGLVFVILAILPGIIPIDTLLLDYGFDYKERSIFLLITVIVQLISLLLMFIYRKKIF